MQGFKEVLQKSGTQGILDFATTGFSGELHDYFVMYPANYKKPELGVSRLENWHLDKLHYGFIMLGRLLKRHYYYEILKVEWWRIKNQSIDKILAYLRGLRLE